MKTQRLVTTACVLVFMSATASHAYISPENVCQKGRHAAAAKYAACHENARAWNWSTDHSPEQNYAKFSKCRVKYTETWAKLQAKASGTGSTCDNTRYQDNGDGTVIDRLTGLQWEQTTDDSGLHDKDNSYTWSVTPPDYTTADGTVFSFLQFLNGIVFAGHSDWRLPTAQELQTILLEPYPCATSPCIDETKFGPTQSDIYWSATASTGSVLGPMFTVSFVGHIADTSPSFTNYVRAVRGGL